MSALPINQYAPGIKAYRKEEGKNLCQILQKVRDVMDSVTMEMEMAKTAIMENAATSLLLPGTGHMRSLLLEGPPGCGKTTFVKRAVSEALNKPVCVINMAGAKNSEVFLGHDYTYEGSRPGRIVEELIGARVCDPIILIDEVDKISDSSGGREVMNLLMALTDPSQNKAIKDTYLSGIPLDLSRIFIIFTCNHIENVDPILLDRVRIINVLPPTSEEKKIAIRDFIIPRLMKEMGIIKDEEKDVKDKNEIPILPEDKNEVDQMMNKIMHLCERKDSSNGMRYVEKVIERIIMNSNIRCIMEENRITKSRIIMEDIDHTIKKINEESKYIEKSQHMASKNMASMMYI